MLDKKLLALPGARKAFLVLLVLGACDAMLIVAQALCLSAAVVVLWAWAPGAAGGGGAAAGVGSAGASGAGWLAATGSAGGALAQAAGWTLGFVAAYLLRQLLGTLRQRKMDSFARKTASDLRIQLLRATYNLGPAGIQERGTGAATAALIEGIDAVRAYIGLLLPKVADLIAVPAVLTVAMLAIDWISGLIALIILPCIIGYMRLLGAHAKAQATAQHQVYDQLSNHFMDTLRGMPTLKAFGRSRAYGKQVYAVSERFREATVKTLRAATLSSLVLDLFRTFGLAAVAIMLGFRLMDGSIQLFPALAVLIVVPEYFAAVRRYASDFHASLDGRTNLASILQVIQEADENRGDSGSVAAPGLAAGGSVTADPPTPPAAGGSPASAPAVAPWGPESQLTLDHVGVRLGEADALRNISLQITGFAKIGVVGRSGSGKSTLAHLLAGFLAPTSGSLRWDQAALPSLAAPDWLRHVTFIPQDPHIFTATLRENVAFYVPDATNDQVVHAVELAGLAELVEQLPQGLDTLIGQGGRPLSGGQAQRIALARAFLDQERRVLVFDEPTAHLDIETELALKERMLPCMEGRLVIFATHRLHWVSSMDLIVVLEDGRIAEVGAPEQLRRNNGAFCKLARQLQGGEVA